MRRVRQGDRLLKSVCSSAIFPHSPSLQRSTEVRSKRRRRDEQAKDLFASFSIRSLDYRRHRVGMGTRQISRDTLFPAPRLSTPRRDPLLSRYESCDCRYEFFGYDDYRVIAPAKGRLIFSDGFVFCLAFIVFEKFSNPGLVPASWKSISFFHLCFFFMRRLNAASGLPSKSYAVITNRLSGFGSRT